MADPIITDVAGLQLSNNTFSASPPGSLQDAQNVVISQKGVAQLRNGEERASTMPASTVPFQEVEFQRNQLVQYGTSKTDTSQKLGYVSAGAITPYTGTYNPVGANGVATDYARMHFTLASLFLHFCAASGPRVLEAYNGTPRRSGLAPPPDIRVVTLKIPTGTMLGPVPYNSSVAYQYTHKRILSTGQVLISAPSTRYVFTNRFVAQAGALVRTLTTTVTATIVPGEIYSGIGLVFGVGTPFALSPSEGYTADADFPAGNYTPSSSGLNPYTVVFPSAGANVASTVPYEMNPGRLYGRARIPLKADIVAGDIIQLYRSAGTSDSSIEPEADVYLVAEHIVTSGEIVTGFIDIDDYTPESVLKVPGYWNPSDGNGNGAEGAKLPPPIYLDSANFDSKTFYLSTTGQQHLDLQMLGVGGPDGVQVDDTFTIFDGVATTKTYTFKTSPTVTTEVRLISDGLPGYNIAWTTLFLVGRINTDFAALGVQAYAVTSPSGFPGGIRLERTDYLPTAIQLKASRPLSWTPALSASVYTNSFGDSRPNGLVWGYPGEPEAVPPTNTVGAAGVGTSNYYGRRVFGLRNSLIIFKEGDGIWSYSGNSLEQISLANIIAPDCAAVFADCAWAYTDQGIVRVSDSGGTAVVSRPLETVLNALAAELPTETYAWSFAVPYETERRIMFFVPFEAATAAQGGAPLMKAWAYSLATNAWTGPLVFGGNPICGLVSTAHKLWLGIFDMVFAAGRLVSERKTGTVLDFADAAWSNTLTVTADPLVVALATAGDIQQGSGISQVIDGTTYYTKIEEVFGDGTYAVSETIPWENGACTIYDPFEASVKFLPAGTPGSRKSLSRLVTLYKPDSFGNFFGRATIETDQMQDELPIPTVFLGFGLTPFGESFGNASPMVVDTNPIGAKWANAGQFFPGFRLNEVWAKFKLQDLGMQIAPADGPVGRGT